MGPKDTLRFFDGSGQKEGLSGRDCSLHLRKTLEQVESLQDSCGVLVTLTQGLKGLNQCVSLVSVGGDLLFDRPAFVSKGRIMVLRSDSANPVILTTVALKTPQMPKKT